MEYLDTLKERTEDLFFSKFGTYPTVLSSAPGRINIIGEHTDYAEGLSLPAAINRWICIAFRKREDQKIRAFSHNYGDAFFCTIHEELQHSNNWSKFLWGAFKLLQDEYDLPSGFECTILGNVPLGSGVSSSAALEMALINGLADLFNLSLDNYKKIKLGQQVEHQFLGVKCGLLDQFAVQFGSANDMLLIDFKENSHHVISSQIEGYSWVLVNTMISRELASSAYTIRVNEMNECLSELESESIKHLRDISPPDITRLSDPVLKQRLNHFISENNRVIDAVKAIESGDPERLGKLLFESHLSLQHDYKVSCPELDFLANSAMQITGCEGARMMGGGFGGCTINLVQTVTLESFEDAITKAYLIEYGKLPGVDVFQLVDGARIHDLTTNLKKEEITTP